MICNVCKKTVDDLILPIVKYRNIGADNMCEDCYSQYENLLTIEENKRIIQLGGEL